MAAESGGTGPSVEHPEVRKKLEDEPCSFEFFQAVRLLERLFANRAPVGHFVPPNDEVVHFGAHASTSFPASDIQNLEFAKPPNESKPHKMTVNFMGLTGPNGVLPTVYDESVEPERSKERPFADFLDIFNHRLISLFYRSWSKYRFETDFEKENEDPLAHCLMGLVGLGTTGLQRRQRVIDDVLLYFSGLVAVHQRSAAGLKQILLEYFGVNVQIEQFAGRWRKLDPKAQSHLNGTRQISEKLAHGVIAGDEVWDAQSGVRIQLGPLTMRQYLDFLPGKPGYEAIKSIVRFYSGIAVDFEVQLILQREAVQGCSLGSEAESGPRLGWITWIKSAPSFDRNPADTVLEL